MQMPHIEYVDGIPVEVDGSKEYYQVLTLQDAGLPISQIAMKTGLEESTVRHCLRYHWRLDKQEAKGKRNGA